jgi:hypothetical protein
MLAGLWGGVVILGSAPVQGGELNIEGFASTTATLYGGSNAADNSGVLSYIRIWHGGSVLSLK